MAARCITAAGSTSESYCCRLARNPRFPPESNYRMKRATAFAALLLGLTLALPAAAQLQYFGYVGLDFDTDVGKTKAYSNFVHLAADAPQDPYFLSRVQGINARGLKVTIDLGKIFFCAPDYTYLCSDWQTRWNSWKAYNTSILASSKVAG